MVHKLDVPVAPGVPAKMVEDVLVLDYGDPASLEVIRAHADELAAVLVEPVQSRNPDLQPKQFLHELRKLTEESGIALIFDEMITGFRVHPRGAQGWFGVQADIAAYGKIVGGGMPMGMIAGKAAFMDALDGGLWQYGDDSFPEAGVTFFGGTFVRHPLALAAAWATLNHLKEQGPQLQQQLNEKSNRFAREINDYLEAIRVPIHIANCGSLFHFDFHGDQRFSELLFYHLREKGVHLWYRPSFLSTAHTDEDIRYVIDAFKQSAAELKEGGFLSESFDGPLPASDLAGTNIVVPASETRSPLVSTNERPSAHSDGNDGATRELIRDLPLTESQMEIWLAARQGDDASCAFNLSSPLRIKGKLNLAALEKAIQGVVDRHEALRTTFSPDGDYQRIFPHVEIGINHIDLSGLSSGKREEKVEDILLQESVSPFELTLGPLVRAQIVKLEESHHLLVLTLHHIVCDGWSFRVLLADLLSLYATENQGANFGPAEPAQFSEYVAWLGAQQDSHDLASSQGYWLEQFANPPPVLELPTDHPRPPVRTHRSGRQIVTMDNTFYTSLKRLSAQSNCTPFSTLLAASQVLLHRLSGQEDIVIGISAAGQPTAEMTDLVGHCVNFLPLRSFVDGNQTFVKHLKSVQSRALSAYEHQEYTYGNLLKDLKLPRDPSRLPLVSAIFTLESAVQGLETSDLDIEFMDHPKRFCNFELELYLLETAKGLTIDCNYNSDLFEDETVRRWMGRDGKALDGTFPDFAGRYRG